MTLMSIRVSDGTECEEFLDDPRMELDGISWN
jgi:hypothetical protein